VTPTPVVSLRGVTKSYGPGRGVMDLDLEVAEGELLAVLGPNGAGKTTTVEIMEGYRRPDRGTVRVLGLDPARDRRRCVLQLGIMLQEGGVYPSLSVGEAVRLFASYFANPVPPGELLELVGLSERARSRYRTLSGGERQRLSLALALVGRPRLLFLDEPTAGMDPRARLVTWEAVREQRSRGVTVLLTTHSMEEAERLADRVAIINQGRLVALDTPAALIGAGGGGVVELETTERLTPAGLAKLSALPSVERSREAAPGRYLLRTTSPPQALAEVVALLRDEGPQVLRLQVGGGSLEEVFLELTGGAE
jgi:ABC-2 type transport system ATP-binding protein